MCSIAMPGELMLGHSPPAYGHHRLYAHHQHHHHQHQHHRPPLVVNPPPQQQPVSQGVSSSTRSVPPAIRPCLSSGAILESGGDAARKTEAAVAAAIARRKKRVVFADDRGRPLTQIRVMSEPSNAPPVWTNAFLAGVTRGVRWGEEPQDAGERGQQQQAEVERSESRWETGFVQPASDYLAFRRKLDEEAVSLENVILREAEQCLVGTIKVKNLTYDKEVVVRVSSDGWASHEDVHCTYVEQPSSVPQAALVLYDTFRFRLTLPLKSDQVEFCVRYRAARTAEYWDNNGGRNYLVRKRHHQSQLHQKHQKNLRRTVSLNDVGSSIDPNNPIFGRGAASPCHQSERGVTRITDATRANMLTWSEFASWQHLNNDTPYW
ncbi:protein phosphatase 1 regulatory subunit 3C-B [Venturia canescens]|uniref:protein phosphatase 1 regulatory subunit 3C-B n=1 Tax=Venturia canescens TaxID=32260 RepID=UPI001C9C1BA1|nr:protein phosphatase 1 regulatory subunit 3C-B [Venturia canescens]